jgi:cyclopropane-fatty-acyl-phospholipid synthase
VREKYAAIARDSDSCCGPQGCGDGADSTDLDVTMIGDDYDDVAGYVADADLKLGCGVPTELADMQPGDHVLDLGSGAGLDAFTARKIVGASGRVVGLDMTPEMVEKARRNAETLDFDNVAFVEGDIEAIPLDDESFDVVISNCVLNLVPNKERAFAEMHRVLRPGGRFCVSDIVTVGDLPDAVRRSAALYAGCISGAVDEGAYLSHLEAAGFEGVEVARRKPVDVPAEVLLEHADEDDVRRFRENGGIVSVTVRGRR